MISIDHMHAALRRSADGAIMKTNHVCSATLPPFFDGLLNNASNSEAILSAPGSWNLQMRAILIDHIPKKPNLQHSSNVAIFMEQF